MGHFEMNARGMEEILREIPQVREKAVVDIVNGLEVVGDHIRWREGNEGYFLTRLWDGLSGETARRRQNVDRGVQGILEGVSDWLHALQAAQAESDLALTRIAERLLETRQGVMRLQAQHRELRDEVAALDRRLEALIKRSGSEISALRHELSIESAGRRAWNAVSRAGSRWRNPGVGRVPPLLRLLLAADELYWRDFGAFLRLNATDPKDARELVGHAEDTLAKMAADFAASEGSKVVVVDCWLEPLEQAGIPEDWRDAIAYLLEGASPDDQPLVVSAAMSMQGAMEELPDNRPRLVQPPHLGKLAMQETVRRIESDRDKREAA